MDSIHHSEIRWTPEPLPRIETIPRDDADLADLSHDALLAYAIELRLEITGLRSALHAACAALHQIRTAALTLRENRDRLIQETRELRAYVMARDAAA
jgi:hypothetical protein